jgi:hypothetical protein
MRVELDGSKVTRLNRRLQARPLAALPGPGGSSARGARARSTAIDAIDLATRARHTLVEGGVFYRTLAPSPDGRFLAVTRSWDSGVPPFAACWRAQGEVRLLDAAGGSASGCSPRVAAPTTRPTGGGDHRLALWL